MRLFQLIKGDFIFLKKYGIFYLYSVLIVIYCVVLLFLPSEIKAKAGSFLILSDPAAVGLFFMGALVLLEKSQRVLNLIAVSPVKPIEYMISKVITLGSISIFAGVLLLGVSGQRNILSGTLGIGYSSALFSLAGIYISTKIHSLNQFMMYTVPAALFCFVPIILYITGTGKRIMIMHPCVSAYSLLEGGAGYILLKIVYLTFWCAGLGLYCGGRVKEMFKQTGGIAL